ncbi:MAG: transporter substrate-binding domain-containing protein [Campylobacteraceae bacterium]|nr:transporter substrate-binding domain-containing protein [Campylobacteraceae bacterium]
MKFPLFTFLFIVVLLFQNLQGEIIKVRFVGNNWCPQHCINSTQTPGYLVELAKAALEISKIQSSMTFQPWLRAIKNVNDGSYDGLLTPAQSEETQLLRHKTALASQRFCFYAKKKDLLLLEKLEDFKNKTIAFTKGNNLGNAFMTYIQDKRNKVRLTQLVSNNEEFAPRIFRFLLKRRIDAIAITEDFGDYYLGLYPKIKKQVEKKFCTKKELLHVGLSPSNKERSEEIAKLIDLGLEKIKENGTYDKILNKYFLK